MHGDYFEKLDADGRLAPKDMGSGEATRPDFDDAEQGYTCNYAHPLNNMNPTAVPVRAETRGRPKKRQCGVCDACQHPMRKKKMHRWLGSSSARTVPCSGSSFARAPAAAAVQKLQKHCTVQAQTGSQSCQRETNHNRPES